MILFERCVRRSREAVESAVGMLEFGDVCSNITECCKVLKQLSTAMPAENDAKALEFTCLALETISNSFDLGDARDIPLLLARLGVCATKWRSSAVSDELFSFCSGHGSFQ